MSITPTGEALTDARVRALDFAVFDEFGKGADDRVQDYGQRCFNEGREFEHDRRAALATHPPAVQPVAPAVETQSYAEWCGDIADEAMLRRAVSVMEDVLGDIADWEDTSLAEAVESVKTDLQAMVDMLSMRGAATPSAEAQPTPKKEN